MTGIGRPSPKPTIAPATDPRIAYSALRRLPPALDTPAVLANSSTNSPSAASTAKTTSSVRLIDPEFSAGCKNQYATAHASINQFPGSPRILVNHAIRSTKRNRIGQTISIGVAAASE